MSEDRWSEGFTVTVRQRELAALLIQDKPRHEIAEALGIESASLSSILAAFCKVIGVPGRDEAIATLKHRGLPDARAGKKPPRKDRASVRLTVVSVVLADSMDEKNPDAELVLLDIEPMGGTMFPKRWLEVVKRNLPKRQAIYTKENIPQASQLLKDLQAFARLHGDNLKVEHGRVPENIFSLLRRVMW